MPNHPDYGAISYLRSLFKASPPRNGPRPVMDTYVRPAPARYSTGMAAAPASENWFSKAFKYPFVGHSPEMDELTKNHWAHRRGLAEYTMGSTNTDMNMWPGPVLFGRPSYGARGIANRQFLVQRDVDAVTAAAGGGGQFLLVYVVYMVLSIVLVCIALWACRRRMVARRARPKRGGEHQRTAQSVERARFGV
ncbi:hypothetical protein DFP73DRAFT_633894 [Morchella snyderi]|nr:hypothetical protein DFP73DRAFT_633894 [Morchella snyderi]